MWLEQVFDYISDFNITSVILRIIMAVIFGSLIGLDRTRKGRPAGLRTYSMVCLGAALTMLIGEYMNIQGFSADPARIGAQVVSGVGFLGAGTILLKNKNQVKGLTTAAGLWASACLGLAIGVGFYLAALAGLLAIVFIETFMHRFDIRIKNTGVVNLYVELIESKNLGSMILLLKNNGISISEIESTGVKEGNLYSYFLALRIPKQCKQTRSDIVQIIGESEGIVFCEEIN